MDECSLYKRLLGIESPWAVQSVTLLDAAKEVVVRVELEDEAVLSCPVCAKPCPGYDSAERRWRHLDSCGFKTYLSAAVPRIKCKEHGVLTIPVPWSLPKSRFTLEFECFAIKVIGMVKSQARVASILNLSPGQIHDIMHKAVARGMARRKVVAIEHISLDEKAFQRQRRYATILTDISRCRILDVAPERTSESAAELLKSALSPTQLKSLRSATMDMWDGFIRAVREVSDADIVFDRFHVAKYLNEAVDRTRIAEHKKLQKEGDSRLKGSKFFWVSRYENLKEKQLELYGSLKDANLETAKAWALKESFRAFFAFKSIRSGTSFFKSWLKDVQQTENPQLLKVGKMLKRYFYGLKNYLVHRQTNSAAEGVNSMIQEIKFCARGFRTFQGFRVAVLFHLGKLDLYPHKFS